MDLGLCNTIVTVGELAPDAGFQGNVIIPAVVQSAKRGHNEGQLMFGNRVIQWSRNTHAIRLFKNQTPEHFLRITLENLALQEIRKGVKSKERVGWPFETLDEYMAYTYEMFGILNSGNAGDQTKFMNYFSRVFPGYNVIVCPAEARLYSAFVAKPLPDIPLHPLSKMHYTGDYAVSKAGARSRDLAMYDMRERTMKRIPFRKILEHLVNFDADGNWFSRDGIEDLFTRNDFATWNEFIGQKAERKKAVALNRLVENLAASIESYGFETKLRLYKERLDDLPRRDLDETVLSASEISKYLLELVERAQNSYRETQTVLASIQEALGSFYSKDMRIEAVNEMATQLRASEIKALALIERAEQIKAEAIAMQENLLLPKFYDDTPFVFREQMLSALEERVDDYFKREVITEDLKDEKLALVADKRTEIDGMKNDFVAGVEENANVEESAFVRDTITVYKNKIGESIKEGIPDETILKSIERVLIDLNDKLNLEKLAKTEFMEEFEKAALLMIVADESTMENVMKRIDELTASSDPASIEELENLRRYYSVERSIVYFKEATDQKTALLAIEKKLVLTSALLGKTRYVLSNIPVIKKLKESIMRAKATVLTGKNVDLAVVTIQDIKQSVLPGKWQEFFFQLVIEPYYPGEIRVLEELLRSVQEGAEITLSRVRSEYQQISEMVRANQLVVSELTSSITNRLALVSSGAKKRKFIHGEAEAIIHEEWRAFLVQETAASTALESDLMNLASAVSERIDNIELAMSLTDPEAIKSAVQKFIEDKTKIYSFQAALADRFDRVKNGLEGYDNFKKAFEPFWDFISAGNTLLRLRSISTFKQVFEFAMKSQPDLVRSHSYFNAAQKAFLDRLEDLKSKSKRRAREAKKLADQVVKGMYEKAEIDIENEITKKTFVEQKAILSAKEEILVEKRNQLNTEKEGLEREESALDESLKDMAKKIGKLPLDDLFETFKTIDNRLNSVSSKKQQTVKEIAATRRLSGWVSGRKEWIDQQRVTLQIEFDSKYKYRLFGPYPGVEKPFTRYWPKVYFRDIIFPAIDLVIAEIKTMYSGLGEVELDNVPDKKIFWVESYDISEFADTVKKFKEDMIFLFDRSSDNVTIRQYFLGEKVKNVADIEVLWAYRVSLELKSWIQMYEETCEKNLEWITLLVDNFVSKWKIDKGPFSVLLMLLDTILFPHIERLKIWYAIRSLQAAVPTPDKPDNIADLFVDAANQEEFESFVRTWVSKRMEFSPVTGKFRDMIEEYGREKGSFNEDQRKLNLRAREAVRNDEYVQRNLYGLFPSDKTNGYFERVLDDNSSSKKAQMLREHINRMLPVLEDREGRRAAVIAPEYYSRFAMLTCLVKGTDYEDHPIMLIPSPKNTIDYEDPISKIEWSRSEQAPYPDDYQNLLLARNSRIGDLYTFVSYNYLRNACIAHGLCSSSPRTLREACNAVIGPKYPINILSDDSLVIIDIVFDKKLDSEKYPLALTVVNELISLRRPPDEGDAVKYCLYLWIRAFHSKEGIWLDRVPILKRAPEQASDLFEFLIEGKHSDYFERILMETLRLRGHFIPLESRIGGERKLVPSQMKKEYPFNLKGLLSMYDDGLDIPFDIAVARPFRAHVSSTAAATRNGDITVLFSEPTLRKDLTQEKGYLFPAPERYVYSFDTVSFSSDEIILKDDVFLHATAVEGHTTEFIPKNKLLKFSNSTDPRKFGPIEKHGSLMSFIIGKRLTQTISLTGNSSGLNIPDLEIRMPERDLFQGARNLRSCLETKNFPNVVCGLATHMACDEQGTKLSIVLGNDAFSERFTYIDANVARNGGIPDGTPLCWENNFN